MKALIIIFIGGGLGSAFRFLISQLMPKITYPYFPLGTLTVNIIACFVLGIIISLVDQKQLFSPATKMFWTIGFCGGFSTFSAFSYDIITLVQSELSFSAILYMVLSVLLALTSTLAGLYLGKII